MKIAKSRADNCRILRARVLRLNFKLMKTLYFDCFAGASGNMILGALVALGVDENELVEQIKLLNVAEFEIKFSMKDKSGISATHAAVEVPREHAHRHLSTIEKIIGDSRLSENVKTRAIKIFRKLAEAEATVHGTTVEKIHFHEVGAMDAIIDVVGACVGFEMLAIEKFACSKIHVGSGFVKMAHGKFPVPPPAVAELLQNIPIYSTEIEGELITPTGAAIIAAVCESFGQIPGMRVERTAYGAGTREYKDFPNVLRLMIGEVESQGSRKVVEKENYPQINTDRHELENESREQTNPKSDNYLLLIETNIDDLSPQILGFVMERAFDAGALDCWFTPIQMKKNRPATMVSILCKISDRAVLADLLYTETTTLGVRVSVVERNCLSREIVKIDTESGAVAVKIARHNGKIVNAKPEYEQIREIALKSNVPLKEIERKILEKFKQKG
ncbi:MAG: nickel pincer cofactor biosynthesis protein LarC [Acidobacteriota bacterium]|nr:nickel pincer cofactor biosynthesis protein LarC [Acidobacteriota bacterium]